MRVHRRHFDNWSHREGPPEQPGSGPAHTPDCRDEVEERKMCFPTSLSVIPRAHYQCGWTSHSRGKGQSSGGSPRTPECGRITVVPWDGELLRQIPARPRHQTVATVSASSEVNFLEMGIQAEGSVPAHQRIAALRKSLNTF